MLQNAYFLAKIGADTAENEQHFAEILPTDALWRLRLGGPDEGARRGAAQGAERGPRRGVRRGESGGALVAGDAQLLRSAAVKDTIE